MSWDPAWKSLVRQLVDEGRRSPHLERLRARYDVGPSRESIERELVQEMAGALCRAEDKVDRALLELELLAERCDARGDRESAEAFNAKRRHALRVRRDLLIHRDALRFPRDPRFEQRYPVPPPRPVPGEAAPED
ncbi:MAG TPA: hypothetical protein RMH99_09370 [Sandaracinaceae bacterium LLY-WYZ-13_1]|nr:hypothetical protein [Sandaracinaceae bacterium LLY-WYZ-13_1]